MKILLVSQYFYPENFKGNDIAFELTRRGYKVTVLTGIPNYPEGKFYEGYGFFKKRRETVNGVKIIRTFLLPRGNSSAIPLMLNYLSWSFFASLYAIYFVIFNKFDKIIVQQLSPVFVGIPAIIIKKIQKTPVYFWVLDLWPESLESAGGLKNKTILELFSKIVKFLYNNSDKILISSKSFKKSILEKGDFENKIIYFPNWAEDSITAGIISEIEHSEKLLPNGFNVLFAGNIGKAQDLENVFKAFEIIAQQNIKINFVVLGDGRDKDRLENIVALKKLEKSIFFLGKFPLEKMPNYFKEADCLFVSLKDEPIFTLTLPAKVQAYMSSGKPIISMMNGEGFNTILEANCGFSVAAEDYENLAENIILMRDLSQEQREELGKNGKKYYEENFLMKKCIDNLEKIIA
jgi:glycosyltransferase involved in cell wall biosynthesis